MGRNWVVDASPVITLAEAGYADLLSASSDDLLIPQTVANEVAAADVTDSARQWLEAKGQAFVRTTDPLAPAVAGWDLGRGEGRVISHAFRHPRWSAIVDDGAGRRCAGSLEIPVIGTLGLLLVAKKVGELELVRPAVDALVEAGLYVDDAIISEILEMAGEE